MGEVRSPVLHGAAKIQGEKWSTYEPEQLHEKKEGQSRHNQGKESGSRNGFCHQNKWVLGLGLHFCRRLAWEDTSVCLSPCCLYSAYTGSSRTEGHAYPHQHRDSLMGKLFIPRPKTKKRTAHTSPKGGVQPHLAPFKMQAISYNSFSKTFSIEDFFLGIFIVVRLPDCSQDNYNWKTRLMKVKQSFKKLSDFWKPLRCKREA